jgi:hypothetical protein
MTIQEKIEQNNKEKQLIDERYKLVKQLALLKSEQQNIVSIGLFKKYSSSDSFLNIFDETFVKNFITMDLPLLFMKRIKELEDQILCPESKLTDGNLQ